MIKLNAAVARATEHLRSFYRMLLGTAPRGYIRYAAQPRPTVYLKRSFIG